MASYTKSESILLLSELFNRMKSQAISNKIFLQELWIFCAVFYELNSCRVGSSGQDSNNTLNNTLQRRNNNDAREAIPPCRLLRTPYIVTNNWKIKLLPNPVGSIAITSLPLKIWRSALSCSFFNEKTIPVSLNFNKISLKHTIQNLPHVPPILIF